MTARRRRRAEELENSGFKVLRLFPMSETLSSYCVVERSCGQQGRKAMVEEPLFMVPGYK
jgi:hypothetical protein